MRSALRAMGGAVPAHVGLAYDVWAPIDDAKGEGKVPDGSKQAWLKSIAAQGVPRGYAAAYARWLTSLREGDSRAYLVQLTSRLLLGHGNAAPTEVGLTVHHTWGVPIIPGSALKGLLAHYLQIVYGPADTKTHPLDRGADERAPYQGVHWEGPMIKHGPGEIYRELLGAPAAESDAEWRSPEQEAAVGALQGCVAFHDALLAPSPGAGPLFGVDVLTVHQKPYYDSKGTDWPNDYSDPTPIPFLTVRPGTQFLLALSGPAEWTALAVELLKPALAEWGVGGKTAAGYGRVDPAWKEVLAPALVVSPVLAELEQFLVKREGTAAERMRALQEVWVPRLSLLAQQERLEAWNLLKKNISEDRRTKEPLSQIKATLLRAP